MTLWEFAIARHFAQMLAESEARTLTDKEVERLEVLGRCVERYEGREILQPGDRQAAAQRKHVVDDSRRKPRPADQDRVYQAGLAGEMRSAG